MADEKVRIDKWLWAARFYKTRAIASEAVNGGKVHLNGQRIKPARAVKIGDLYEIHRGFDRLKVEVLGLSSRRGSATIAQQLYKETDDSIEQRQREAEQRKLAALSKPVSKGKPSKRDRRKIIHFTSQNLK